VQPAQRAPVTLDRQDCTRTSVTGAGAKAGCTLVQPASAWHLALDPRQRGDEESAVHPEL